MKRLFSLLLVFLISTPGFLTAQTNVTGATPVQMKEESLVSPDKLFFFIILGLFIVFILFIIFALSKAASALSDTLGDQYKSKT